MKAVFFFFGVFTGIFALLITLGFIAIRATCSNRTATVSVRVEDFPKTQEKPRDSEPAKPAARACKGKESQRKRKEVALLDVNDGIQYGQSAGIPGSTYDYRK